MAKKAAHSSFRPRSYDCTNVKLWENYVEHGFDQVQLNRKDWAEQLDAFQCGDIDIPPFADDLETPFHSIDLPQNWPLEVFPMAENNS
jgi:hypothetical protein